MKIKDFFIIMISTVVMIYILMNTSIKLYLEQQHYEERYPFLSPFEYLNHIPNNKVFTFADELKKILTLQSIHTSIPFYTQKDLQNMPDPTPTTTETPSHTEEIIALPAELPESSLPQKEIIIPEKIEYTLHKGDKILLIGDSLMQGVGMTLVSRLNQHGAKVINLSKQNTGLTYKKYFDWEQTLEQTLKEQPNIKYIIALFGANDPWDMPNPSNQARHLKFKSKEWEIIYRQRIEAILTLSQQYNAQIFWYQVPRMKNKKLDENVAYLNTLYEEEVKKAGGVFLPSNTILSEEDHFSAYITNQSQQKIKVRTNDGIHFTGAGSRMLSTLLIDHFTINHNDSKQN